MLYVDFLDRCLEDFVSALLDITRFGVALLLSIQVIFERAEIRAPRGTASYGITS
jgi:hypothetical protein